MTNAFADNLVLFFEKLRSRGLTVGIAEALDVFTLLTQDVLCEKEKMRISMRALLAKSTREQEVFDYCFEEFFVSSREIEQQEVQAKEVEEKKVRQRQEALDELTFNGEEIDISDDLREIYAEMDAEKREKLKNYLGMSNVPKRRSPFAYKYMKRLLEQHLRLEDAQYENHDDTAAGTGGSDGDLLYKDISKITEDEMPRAINLIQTMVKQLNGAISRKFKRSGRSGRLDFRATIRANMGTGGNFHTLKYKNKRRSRRKIILLCDVSGSMLKYSEFAIRFIKSMSDVSDSSRVFVFSEGISEVSPFVLEEMSTFQNFVKNSGLWGKGTDIGSAVNDLLEIRPTVSGNNSILMVISDSKSVKLDEARLSVMRASKHMGRIIWLNPIPGRKWQKLGSVTSFVDLCEMLDCSTINELSRACAKSLVAK